MSCACKTQTHSDPILSKHTSKNTLKDWVYSVSQTHFIPKLLMHITWSSSPMHQAPLAAGLTFKVLGSIMPGNRTTSKTVP